MFLSTFHLAEQSDQSRDDSPSVIDKELDDHFTSGIFKMKREFVIFLKLGLMFSRSGSDYDIMSIYDLCILI